MMTGKKPKNHPLCKINKQVRLKSAVEILGVLTPPLKMTALLFEARVGKRSQRGEIYPPLGKASLGRLPAPVKKRPKWRQSIRVQ